MLVMCNGVYKSGSTWVFLMLLELFDQGAQSEEWSDPNQARNFNVLNAPEDIFAAGRAGDIVSKIHSYEADYLAWLRANDARTVVTVRDEMDILASHYHHFSKEKLHLPAWLYAATIGFAKALEVAIYKDVATRPEAADLVIDFAELKTDPENVLTKIVETFALGYNADQIAAASQKANMRGRAYGETFAGMEDRTWFFRRDDKKLGKNSLRAIGLSLRVARSIVSIKIMAAALTWMFHLDPRRAIFRKYRASKADKPGVSSS